MVADMAMPRLRFRTYYGAAFVKILNTLHMNGYSLVYLLPDRLSTESHFGAKDNQLSCSSTKCHIDSPPVFEQRSNLLLSVIPHKRDDNTILFSSLVVSNLL